MLPQLTNLMSGLLGTLTFFKNVFIGIIIAIYVLNSKQLFAAQAKKLLYGCLSTRRANIVLDNARFTHRVFGGFINGKLLDSLIIGILCFVGMTALRMPYAMLISVVVGLSLIHIYAERLKATIDTIYTALIVGCLLYTSRGVPPWPRAA